MRVVELRFWTEFQLEFGQFGWLEANGMPKTRFVLELSGEGLQMLELGAVWDNWGQLGAVGGSWSWRGLPPESFGDEICLFELGGVGGSWGRLGALGGSWSRWGAGLQRFLLQIPLQNTVS